MQVRFLLGAPDIRKEPLSGLFSLGLRPRYRFGEPRLLPGGCVLLDDAGLSRLIDGLVCRREGLLRFLGVGRDELADDFGRVHERTLPAHVEYVLPEGGAVRFLS